MVEVLFLLKGNYYYFLKTTSSLRPCRVDHLYTFFVQWSPDIYTKGNKKNRQRRFLVKEKHPNHYLVVEKKKVAVINKLLGHSVNPTDKNWEVRTAG